MRRRLEMIGRWVAARAPERWTVVELASAGLLGGGVWAQWGAPVACMLLGLLGLGLVALRELQVARLRRKGGAR